MKLRLNRVQVRLRVRVRVFRTSGLGLRVKVEDRPGIHACFAPVNMACGDRIEVRIKSG